MTYLHAILLGLVEGLTEFLPISSTAHLMLTARALGLDPDDPFLKTFEIAIQPGAILAVVVLYWRRLLLDWPVLQRVLVAFIPTAILGFMVYKVVKQLLGEHEVALIALAVGGVVLILFERFHRKNVAGPDAVAGLTWTQAFLIGCCQAVAFIPGVSRAAATILGGLALGGQRRPVVEFSFLLAVPTMAAATAYDIYKNPTVLGAEQLPLLLTGFLVSFLAALLAIGLLLAWVRTHSFAIFGWYRLVLVGAILLWGWLAVE